MKQPVEPRPEDCCNSGCNPCIFDVYQKQLMLYKKYLKGEHVDLPIHNAISQLEYSNFLLVKNVAVCFAHRLLLFKKVSQHSNCRVIWKPGDHFLLKYTNNGVSCSRAYTPIKPLLCCNSDDDEEVKNSDFAIIVKIYTHGTVTDFLHNLKPGQTACWRGPYGSYDIKPNSFSRIVMIAQGTGVLPFISIIDKILENEDDLTKLILFYCCGNYNTILLRDLLYSYKSYWNFTYKLFLGELPENATIKYSEPIITSKLTLENVSDLLPFSSNDQFLLCGSDHFMEEYRKGILSLCPEHKNIQLF